MCLSESSGDNDWDTGVTSSVAEDSHESESTGLCCVGVTNSVVEESEPSLTWLKSINEEFFSDLTLSVWSCFNSCKLILLLFYISKYIHYTLSMLEISELDPKSSLFIL